MSRIGRGLALGLLLLTGLAEAAVRLEIANGNGIAGLASATGAWLEDEEFDVARLTDAHSFKYGQTFVLYRSGLRQEAEALAARLPVRGVLRQSGQLEPGIDIQLLLGRDFAHQVSTRRGGFRFPGQEEMPPGLDGTARIVVSNGNGTRGMASQVGALLRERGGNVVLMNDADNYDYRRSLLFYREGFREQAQALARSLPVDVRVTLDRDLVSGDLLLVVGHDFPQRGS